MYYNFRYFDSNYGRWIRREPTGEAHEHNLYVIINNNTINKTDALGLVEIRYRVVPPDELDHYYKGDDSRIREQIRYRNGVEIWPDPSTCDCCKKNDGKGIVILAQKILYSKKVAFFSYAEEWDYDGHEKPRRFFLLDGQIITRIPGYTEGTNPGAKGDFPGSYVDSPTIEQTLRVEAWCRCVGMSDRFLTQKDILFKHHDDF